MRGESSKGKQRCGQILTGSSEKLPETRAGKEDVEEADDSFSDVEEVGRMMKGFFESLEKLSLEEINDSARKWQCPACPAAVDLLYQGLHCLAIHTRGKASDETERPHRHFAKILKEELQRRRTSSLVLPEGIIKHREIVWPPMVVIKNTLRKGDDGKWVGMESQELLENFSSFAAARARHSYGPQGRHRGTSMLIFEKSADGYLKAKRLNDHLSKKGTGRQAWDDPSSCFDHGGRPQLYGYLANEDDLKDFHVYSDETQRVEYEMIRYQEMVVSELNKCSEDGLLLESLKEQFDMEKSQSESLEELLKCTSDELRNTLDEILLIVEERSKILNREENQQAMDIHNKFEKEYVLEMEKLNEIHEQKRNELKRRLLEREYDADLELICHEEKNDPFKPLLAMVKQLDANLTQLMQVRSSIRTIIRGLLKER